MGLRSPSIKARIISDFLDRLRSGDQETRLRELPLTLAPDPNEVGQGLCPESLLPMEIWDSVLHELPEDDLLRTSVVCGAFNTLCIAILLARIQHSVHSTDMSIPSGIVPVLQLSLAPSPLQRLAVYCGNSLDLRHLTSLQRLVHRSPNLTSLNVGISRRLLWQGNGAQSPVVYSKKQFLASFCVVVSAMANRIPGPVIFFSDWMLFSCSATDLAAFTAKTAEHPANPGQRWFPLSKNSRGSFLSTGPGASIRKLSEMWANANGESVNVALVRNVPGPCSCYTLVVFDLASITRLDFGGLRPRDSVPPHELTAMLAGLTFPALEEFTLGIDEKLDPRVVGDFMLRHLTMRSFGYVTWAKNTGFPPPVDPPIAHPTLTILKAHRAEVVYPVVWGLYLSPLLGTFSFALAYPEATLSTLTPSLRLISQRSIDTHLDLTIMEPLKKSELAGEYTSLINEEASDIARTLYCIRSIKLTCYSVEIFTFALSWLALIPELLRVEFVFKKTYVRRALKDESVRQAKLNEFIIIAQAKLQNVSQIRGRL